MAQTHSFTLSTQIPSSDNRLPSILNALVRMLNSSDTSTLARNEFLAGIVVQNGGSIAEMIATMALIRSWLDSTRGLNPSNALGFLHNLEDCDGCLVADDFLILVSLPFPSLNI